MSRRSPTHAGFAVKALLETLEVLANPRAMTAIARDRAGKGRYLPLTALDEDEG